MKKLTINTILSFGLIISCNFKSADYYFNDACKKEELGDYKGAIADLDIALEKNPEYLKAYLHRGQYKARIGKYFEAISDYDIALSLDKKNTIALFNRGHSKVFLKRYEEALEDYNNAIRQSDIEAFQLESKDSELINPYTSVIYIERILLQRGLVYAELNRYSEALSDFSYCIESKYNLDIACLWRGVCYYNLGYPDEACIDWKVSFELGIDDAQSYLEEYCQ